MSAVDGKRGGSLVSVEEKGKEFNDERKVKEREETEGTRGGVGVRPGRLLASLCCAIDFFFFFFFCIGLFGCCIGVYNLFFFCGAVVVGPL